MILGQRFSLRRSAPLLLMLALTAFLILVTTDQTLERYRALGSGWSWDLAYYNQWFWALIQGEDLSVRPLGPWAQEGPSVWKMNYLAPIRFVIVPIYWAFPDPRTLLVIQVIAIWMVVPAAFGLVRSESGSSILALSAAALVPLTPLIWPLAWNDFRELQLAPPFVIWAIHGVRARRVGIAFLGVGGLLACRQEFSFLVASLAFLPPKEPEDIGRRYRWARALWLVGLGWLLLGFLVYSRWAVNSYAVEILMGEMGGSRAPLGLTLANAANVLLLGLGSWAVMACLVPRAAWLALPWILSIAGGRWTMPLLGTESWHHVRYTAPMVAMVLALGCLGYARLGSWLTSRRGGPILQAIAWLMAAVGLLVAGANVQAQFAQIPRPISSAEASQLWTWIDRVGPDDGVLAHYEITAPLSSRRSLYSYVMTQNYPRGYPNLAPEIRWVFARAGDLPSSTMPDQGFQLVHEGPHLLVYHRESNESDASVAVPQRNPTPPVLRPVRTTLGLWDRSYDAFGSAVLIMTGLGSVALCLAPGLAVSWWARRSLSKVRGLPGHGSDLTGREIVAAICRVEGVPCPALLETEGPFAPYYDRLMRAIRLPPRVAEGRSPADHAAAARETAHGIRHLQGDPRSLGRDPLVFALKLGTLAGWLLMVSGVALWSWLPLQAGALLVTISILAPLPWLWLIERDASRLAAQILGRAAVIPEDDWPMTLRALKAYTVVEIAKVSLPRFRTTRRAKVRSNLGDLQSPAGEADSAIS